MRTLKGTEKQVAWAEKIRTDYVEKFNESIESLKREGIELEKGVFQTFDTYLKITDCNFWLLDKIKNKRPNKSWILGDFDISLTCGGILVKKYVNEIEAVS